MENRWFIIANPVSGSGLVLSLWKNIERMLRENNICSSVHFPTQSHEATLLVKNAIDTEGYRYIIGMGGDGTMNAVINGIFQQNTVSTNDIFFTMLPIGTGNDWAKTHGLSPDLSLWLKKILNNNLKKQDVGVIEYTENGALKKHYFANAGGLAYDALVVQSVEADKRYIFGKKVSYFLHILKCLWDYKPEKVRISIDDKTVEDFFYTINIGINKTSGGGMIMTPQAENDDGLMALTLIRNMPKWKVIWYTSKLYKGTIGEVAQYVSLYQANNIKVESLQKPIFCETDGELLGVTPVTITVLKQVLNIIC